MELIHSHVHADSKHNENLKLGITNFGPISDGVITIKPLTILLGPNGCGKSHVATLVYTIIKAESVPTLNPLLGMSEMSTYTVDDDIRRMLEKCTPNTDPILSSDIYKNIVGNLVREFSDMLSDALLAKHKKLIRKGAKCFVLDIKSNIIDGKIQYSNEIKFESRNIKKIKLNFKKDNVIGMRIRAAADVLEVDIPFSDTIDESEIRAHIWRRLQYYVIRFLSTGTRGIYFPAERGGLTMAQRSLTLHYYNMRGNASVSSPDPSLAGVATDFLGFLLMSTNRASKFARLAKEFERKAMRGSVAAKSSLGKIPDIVFIQDAEQFPLNSSASSVKDMAAFILYLKHAARRGDAIIFEEPETCLHPDNQVLLAKLLARLVNNGFHVVVTTHSPFFVEQLSNCSVAGTKRDEGGPVPDQEKLDINNIAAYGFVPDDGGYKITQLDVDDEGIPQYEFTKVYDQLYNELLELEAD